VRIEPLVVGAGGDDGPVELRRGVQIVVVRGEPGVRKPVRLLLREHAERAARLHAQTTHHTHHVEHAIELVVVRHVAPRGAHAEPNGPLFPGVRRGVRQFAQRDKVLASHVGLVVGRLRAVGAVLGTTAGLDAQQHAPLDFIGPVMRAVGTLRAKHQVRERGGVDRLDFGNRPVVADVRGIHKGAWMLDECNKNHASSTSTAMAMTT
jgi:hypothetical protein